MRPKTNLRALSYLALFLWVFFGHEVCAAEMNQAAQHRQLSFANAISFPSDGYATVAVAVGDLNGDGIPDMVLVNQGSNSVSVLIGNGNGTFQPSALYSCDGVNAHSVAISDLNEDGIPDLAVASSCASGGCSNGLVSVLLGNGNGTFHSAVSYGSGGVQPWSLAIADVNGDGKHDLVVANSNCTSCIGTVGVLLGEGNGTFRKAVSYGSGGESATFVSVGDLNRDGIPDLVVANLCGLTSCVDGQLGVLIGNGDGTFKTAASYSSGGSNAESVAIADLNGDGIPDLAVANFSLEGGTSPGGVGILLGKGDGAFRPATAYKSGGQWTVSVALSDVNGDGYPDVVVANYLSSSVDVLLGNGNGTFQSPVSYESGGAFAEAVAIADLNRDGRPDLVVASECVLNYCNIGQAGVLLNILSIATTTTVASTPNPSRLNQSVKFTAAVSSAQPIPDGEVVTFYKNGSEIGTAEMKKGKASLTTSFSKGGIYGIKAQYQGGGFLKASSGNLKQVVEQ